VLRCAWAGSQLVEVASIYWQNGDEVSPGLGDLWPADAASMIEAMDEIVLLRLKAPSGWVAPPKLGWAKLIVDPQLAQHDILFVSGFGEDDAGNLPVEFPCCAATRFFGSRSNWRGAVYRDPNLSYAGMPRPGDSGAPVFQLDPLNPAENVRLCGIHSGPADSGETVITQPPHEVGEFLPLHPAVLSWIHKKTGLPLLARTATSSRALLSHAQRTTRTDTFVLRDRFTCFYLTSVNDLDVSTVVGSETEWHLSDVFSPHRYMTACEDVTISGGKLKLNYVGAQPIDLTKETQEGAPFHWLFGSDGKADFYVFRLLDGVAPDGTVRRRIRIEVFVNGSASPRPRPGSGGNIADNTEIAGQGTAIADPCPKPVQHKKPQALRDSHQDDQGNGYERKRN
jgi:hypothetical protein